jgi:hypothetical protein
MQIEHHAQKPALMLVLRTKFMKQKNNHEAFKYDRDGMNAIVL